MHLLLPSSNEVWDKVIFLHLSVILLTGGTGVQIYHFLSRPPPRTAPSGQHHPLDSTNGVLSRGGAVQGSPVNKWSVRILRILLSCLTKSISFDNLQKITVQSLKITTYLDENPVWFADVRPNSVNHIERPLTQISQDKQY